MPKPNFEVIPGGAGEEGQESEFDRQQRMRKENRMTETRIMSDADFIKGGARMSADGRLHLTEQQIGEMQGRLKRIDGVIEHLESNFFTKELDELREKGKPLARDMYKLHSAAGDQKVSRRVMADAAVKGSSIDPYKESHERYEKEMEEPRKHLEDFFLAARAFAERYGLERLGGINLTGGRERYTSVLMEDIAEHFESPDQLLDAIEQVRDAKLYRAHAEKKEITGKM